MGSCSDGRGSSSTAAEPTATVNRDAPPRPHGPRTEIKLTVTDGDGGTMDTTFIVNVGILP